MLFRIQRSRKERTGCAVLAGVELAAAAGARATAEMALWCMGGGAGGATGSWEFSEHSGVLGFELWWL